jgi:pSer/pThr/pTyr-binding forkhead associated (FHA) protein/V8-like Glu-specific endopeptidase
VKVVVEIVSGARAGRRFEFDDPKVLRFGRHPSNDVAFDPEADRDASSRHAELRREGEAWFVYDLGSANGTRIGGKPVGPRTLVAPGTEVEFGDGGPRCRVAYEGARAATVPPTMFKKGAAPLPLPQGTKVGARTVALMIDQAMARVKGTSRRLQIVSISLGVALLLTLAGVVVAFSLRPPPDVALRREMVKVMEQQRAAGDAERLELQKKLDEMNARLAKSGGSAGGSQIARANHDAIFLVTVKTAVQEEGFCTAFAIKPDRLITNAHCVVAAEDYKKRGGAIWVVQNGHPEVRFAVARSKRIAGFFAASGGITPDVGWLKIEGALPKTVALASAAEYQGLGTGDQMYTYGFPGRLADVAAPEATFVEGVVGRITTLDGRVGDAKQAQLIQHSAFTSGGTSGSPIFNSAGHVVAVNTGGYAEAAGDGAGKSASPVVSRSLPGYNFGMRVDLVEELVSEGDE